MTAKAHDLKNQGIDVITLSAGEPDFDIPDYIKDAAVDAINKNYHKYSPVDGYLDLKKAICKKFKRDNNLDYDTDQIVVSTGAKQSIANVCMSLINKGDEVVIPTPYWVSYSAMVSLADGIPVFVNPNKNSNYKVTAKQLESAITNKTKMVMLNSPNNPSGSVFTKEEYLELSKVLIKYPKVIVVSDEIYDSGIVILKIASKDLDLSKLKDDSNVQGNDSDTYEYHGQIPWSKLKVSSLYEVDYHSKLSRGHKPDYYQLGTSEFKPFDKSRDDIEENITQNLIDAWKKETSSSELKVHIGLLPSIIIGS